MSDYYIPYQILSKFGDNPVGHVEGRDELIYLCPYCISIKGTPDTHGHLYVNTKKLTYICHRCDSRGSLKGEKSSKLRSYSSSENYDKLLSNLDGVLNSSSQVSEYPYKIPMKSVEESPRALEYMLSRGFTIDQIRNYNMRVGSATDKFFGRVILPNKIDGLVYTDMYCARSYIGHDQKYLNPYNSYKSEIVFNLHKIPDGSFIHICEGVLSAIAANQYAVAAYGKSISDSQLSQILSKHPYKIYVSLDPDAISESTKLCNKLVNITEIPIYQVIMPEGEDPASLGHERYMNIVESTPQYSMLFNDLNDLLSGIN